MREVGQAGGYVGQGVRRREDPRFLRGRGQYVGDVRLPETAHAAFLRSPYAHAQVRRVNLSRARALPGVLAAISFADLGPDPVTVPMLGPHRALHAQMPFALARDRVRYVGELVAAVVAEDPYLAEDALELIEVDYEELPVVTDATRALAPDSPRVHEDMVSNLAATTTRTVGDPERAFATADLVLRHDFRFGRVSVQPLEPRGAVALFRRDRGGGHVTLWSSTQVPHLARSSLATMLDVDPETIRVVAPDVGGGFGVKGQLYPEEFLVAFLARLVRRPVRWIEDRREDLLTTCPEREQEHHLEIAVRRDGTILALRDHYLVDLGAYSPYGIVVPFNAGLSLVGNYHVPNVEVTMQAVYTNKTPMAPYRGAGRPPGVFGIEHALDLVARELGLGPAAMRARNFVQPTEFPYRLGLVDRDGLDIIYDSGDYPALLEKALGLADVEGFRTEQQAARAVGRYLGLGVGCYVESTGRGPFEGATVRVEPSGQVLVFTGAAPQGQAHETTLAQLCADRLGVPLEDVTVITGDTDTISMGIGTFASRIAVVAGNAVSLAAASVREKALEVAAQLLEVSPQDLELHRGVIRVRGVPDRQLPLAQVARTVTAPPPAFIFPAGLEPGLEATHYFRPPSPTFASGVHVAVVEVDVETGVVKVLRYAVVHDCGRVINPIVVDGQVHGGVAQGLGNALYEELAYDEAGQPRTTSYLDYLIPTAMEVPPLAVGHQETLSPLNPEGIKGAGEGGTMPVPAAIANAIEDALLPLGAITIEQIPITPARLRALIAQATGATG